MRTKKQKIDAGKLLFSNHDLKVLLIPLMVEQLLNSLMGTVDSMMVSNVGSAAISAVSLVDSINVLVIQAVSYTHLDVYKRQSVSRESELFRIQHVICCYADWLRS